MRITSGSDYDFAFFQAFQNFDTIFCFDTNFYIHPGLIFALLDNNEFSPLKSSDSLGRKP